MHCATTELPCLERLDARIPRWSLNKLTPRPCPLCYTANHPSFLRPDLLPVARCSPCSLWYVCAVPPEDEINTLYQGYWLSFRPRDLSSSAARYLTAVRESLVEDFRLDRLQAIAGGLKGKRVLEIGCGCGEFLLAAQVCGASVFANDISAESCAFVGEKLALPVYKGDFSGAECRRRFGAMDVIVMNDLIEHPPSRSN